MWQQENLKLQMGLVATFWVPSLYQGFYVKSVHRIQFSKHNLHFPHIMATTYAVLRFFFFLVLKAEFVL